MKTWLAWFMFLIGILLFSLVLIEKYYCLNVIRVYSRSAENVEGFGYFCAYTMVLILLKKLDGHINKWLFGFILAFFLVVPIALMICFDQDSPGLRYTTSNYSYVLQPDSMDAPDYMEFECANYIYKGSSEQRADGSHTNRREPHGYGKMVWKNGTCYEGFWESGKWMEGLVTYANGTVWNLCVVDDQWVGQIYFNDDGVTLDGAWMLTKRYEHYPSLDNADGYYYRFYPNYTVTHEYYENGKLVNSVNYFLLLNTPILEDAKTSAGIYVGCSTPGPDGNDVNYGRFYFILGGYYQGYFEDGAFTDGKFYDRQAKLIGRLSERGLRPEEVNLSILAKMARRENTK